MEKQSKKHIKKPRKAQETRQRSIPKPSQEIQPQESTVYYTPNMTVSDFAEAVKKPISDVIKKAMMLGIMATQNQSLDRDTAELIALEYDMELKDKVITDITRFDEIKVEEKDEDLVERPPVVTIMGHVDHGKTTLLDTIRNARVTEGEAGGITQHIGAYQYITEGKAITFIDTPGHAAFTEMRARGALITDITVLVVAADDGVMPQTREAIDHAKAAGCPIIVAVNKMDRPGANPERVKQELTEFGLLAEDWGGDTVFVEMSALKGEGVSELIEMILLTAEIKEFKANPNRLASGTVIESKIDKGRGPIATLLVQNGTLKSGDIIVVGDTHGRVRMMTNDLGEKLDQALPSMAVEITGLNDVPQAGDAFMVFSDEKEARQISESRTHRTWQEERGVSKAMSLDEMFANAQEGDTKELRLVVKGDTHGSIEALKSSLENINVEGAKIEIIRSSVGTITETDVTLALASHAIILGFNVRPAAAVRDMAAEKGIEIRLYNIIYKALEEIELAMKGLLDPEFKEIVTGQAEVRETFKVSRVGTIAGCFVTDGYIKRDALVRVLRDGIVVYEGNLASLKRFKDDVKEVRSGFECGIMIERFNDIKEGDLIEASIMKEVSR
ncbi:translation initiation factor IF-2 [Liberiplasma polymorphum]|uniref:translation initiation factor IF-2 n=1 Tax=Liberiplasma polymorphum TaxID=3374570 RepID=UPI003771C565